MDQEDKGHVRLLLAAVFMHARIASGSVTDVAAVRELLVREAFADADALVAESEKESS